MQTRRRDGIGTGYSKGIREWRGFRRMCPIVFDVEEVMVVECLCESGEALTKRCEGDDGMMFEHYFFSF